MNRETIVRTKIAIADAIIDMLDREMREPGFDSRNPAVKAEIERQRDVLLELLEGEQSTGDTDHPDVDSDDSPSAQTVGLKALKMGVKRTGIG